MTYGKRSRGVFLPEVWDRDIINFIKNDLESSGEKLENHVEEVVFGGVPKVRLSEMAAALLEAKGVHHGQLKDSYSNLLGYSTTSKELGQALGLNCDDMRRRIAQVEVLDETHVKKGEDGNYSLSAFAAWLIVSLTPQGTRNREEYLNLYANMTA